jgi:hypothetical protein
VISRHRARSYGACPGGPGRPVRARRQGIDSALALKAIMPACPWSPRSRPRTVMRDETRTASTATDRRAMETILAAIFFKEQQLQCPTPRWLARHNERQRRPIPGNKCWGDGWGWSWFDAPNPQKTTSTDYTMDRQSCHVPARRSDWIYTHGYPVLTR